ncbi:MAG TPA: protein kinase, partial [Thermoanaerobaculia bacterium]|nr:protein kinase [Thermoanaerobaculia bacterium]
HYTITGKLGEGAMGVVFAARDDRLGRNVAIKLIQKDNADEAARQRFWREARAAAAVNHPNICHIYEVGEHQGELFVAMELLEGELLADRIARGAVAIIDALPIMLSVLDGLAAIHRAGLVHRDLKPSNLFITQHGVKLLDFGLARLTLKSDESKTAQLLTTPGTIVGTPRYMAPEQWSGQEVGSATDLFACGTILFEMLTGKAAFEGDSLPALCHAILHTQPPALAGGPEVQALDRVINRALMKRPADRYPEAAAMAQDLRAITTQGSSPVVTQGVRTITRMMVLPFRLLRPDAEIDFLPTSLADAVTASLCGLESLVVRSNRAAGITADADVKKVVSDAEVDVVLVGTLLRSGDKLRLNAQLIDTSGRVLWSKTLQSAFNDIFDLQDELTNRLIESLSVSLSQSGEERIHRDVPATARAYELYLRATHVGVDSFSTSRLLAARDLLRECVREDPRFAPAWARLGRVHRVIAKYGHDAPKENRRQAEEAFRKALEISPDLPLAHNLYTYFELEEMRNMPGAITRLLDQARRRPNDPDLYAGLVTACRFGGMLEASLAADQRARRLDPQIVTSVTYTYWMLGDYPRVIEFARDAVDFPLLMARAETGQRELVVAEMREHAAKTDGSERDILLAIAGSLAGDREATMKASTLSQRAQIPDPEHWFVWTTRLALVQEKEMTLKGLQEAIGGNFCCDEFLKNSRSFDFLRSDPEFQRLIEHSADRHRRAVALFRQAGGEELLGVRV